MRRWMTVLVTFVAWLLLSNHCAIGALLDAQESAPAGSGCPMHSAPEKKKPAAKPLCCKEVRAVLAKCVTATPAAVRVIDRPDCATEVYPPRTQTVIEIAEVDTGPPCLSFAESVLQESMLSHAPPLS